MISKKQKFLMPLIVILTTSCDNTNTQEEVGRNQKNQIIQQARKIENHDEDRVLGNYALLMMDIVNFQGSFAKKNTLARNIVNVSNDIFSSLEEKKQFVTMVAIESKFNSEAVSGAGAVGLTQVIPKYAKEFAEKCGMDDVRQEDLKNPEINLLVGACRFKALLDTFNGNTAAALVAYNAGAGSDQLKQLKSLRNITNVESSSYVAKWLYLKNKADSESKE